MKEIKIIKNDNTFRFIIDRSKTIIGKNNIDIFNFIREYFLKASVSEYGKELKDSSLVFIDNDLLDLKEFTLFEFNNYYYDLTTEYKLNTKSTLYQSLDSLLRSSTIQEHLNTINILLDSLSLEIESLFSENNILLQIDNLEINLKNIIKLIDISFKKDDLLTNQFNYSISELNLIKVNLIELIIKNNVQKKFLIINEDNTLNLSELVKYNNVNILTINGNDNLYDSDNKIDFDNEEDLYDMYMSSTSNLEFELFINKLKERIII